MRHLRVQIEPARWGELDHFRQQGPRCLRGVLDAVARYAGHGSPFIAGMPRPGRLRHVTGKDDMGSGKVTPGLGRPALSQCAGLRRPVEEPYARDSAGQGMRGGAGNGHPASRSQEGRGMRGEQDGGKISQAYQDHRPYLVDLAFRMLGDIGAAEDIVQDAFTRLMATKLGEIEDKRGWLIVVISRPAWTRSSCAPQGARPRRQRDRVRRAAPVRAGRSSRPGHLR